MHNQAMHTSNPQRGGRHQTGSGGDVRDAHRGGGGCAAGSGGGAPWHGRGASRLKRECQAPRSAGQGPRGPRHLLTGTTDGRRAHQAPGSDGCQAGRGAGVRTLIHTRMHTNTHICIHASSPTRQHIIYANMHTSYTGRRVQGAPEAPVAVHTGAGWQADVHQP